MLRRIARLLCIFKFREYSKKGGLKISADTNIPQHVEIGDHVQCVAGAECRLRMHVTIAECTPNVQSLVTHDKTQTDSDNLGHLVLRPLNALQVYTLLNKLPQRTHLSELVDVSHCQLHCPVNLSRSCESPQAKSEHRQLHQKVAAAMRPQDNKLITDGRLITHVFLIAALSWC